MTRPARPLIVMVAAMAVASGPAMAGFKVLKSTPAPVPPTKAAPEASVAVHFLGTPPPTIDLRIGFGRDVPLADALKQIAPPGWHARLKESMLGRFDRKRIVSWRGGLPWTQVLDTLAVEQGFSVEVDWSNQLLLVGPPLQTPLVPTTTDQDEGHARFDRGARGAATLFAAKTQRSHTGVVSCEIDASTVDVKHNTSQHTLKDAMPRWAA